MDFIHHRSLRYQCNNPHFTWKENHHPDPQPMLEPTFTSLARSLTCPQMQSAPNLEPADHNFNGAGTPMPQRFFWPQPGKIPQPPTQDEVPFWGRTPKSANHADRRCGTPPCHSGPGLPPCTPDATISSNQAPLHGQRKPWTPNLNHFRFQGP